MLTSQYQRIIKKSTDPNKRCSLILRAGSVGHRIDGSKEIPNLGSVSVIESPERGPSQMGVMVKYPTQASAEKALKSNTFIPPSANHTNTIQSD